MAENPGMITGAGEACRIRYEPMSTPHTVEADDHAPPARPLLAGADCLGERDPRRTSILSTHLDHAMNTSSRVADGTLPSGQTLRPAPA